MTAGVLLGAGALGLISGGLAYGSVYRIGTGTKAFSSPACGECGEKLKWYDRLPLISYLLSGGKRRCCGAKISPAALMLPLAGAALWIVSALVFFDVYPVYSALAALEITVLLAVATFDLSEKWIPDRYQLALAAIGVAALFFKSPYTVVERLIGAAAGGAFFLIIYLLSLLALKREGLGFGDVKLAFCAGLFTGWQGVLLGIIIASVSASVILLSVRAKTKAEKNTEYPFAPFMAAGFTVAIFIADMCIKAYLRLF